MSRPQYCLLDIDGVLADFVGTACRVHGVENPYTSPKSPHLGNFEMSEVLKMSPGKFWLPFNHHETWEEMETTHDAFELIETVCNYFAIDRIALCSAPSASPWSASGKMEWVRRNLYSFRRRLILTPAKEFLAHDNVVLIDDRSRNCRQFRNAGGHAILVPRPWNTDYELSDVALDVVRVAIEELKI